MYHDRHIPHLSLLHQAVRRSPASSVLDIGTSLRTPSFSFFMVSSKKNKRMNRETIIKNEHGHNFFSDRVRHTQHQTVLVIKKTHTLFLPAHRDQRGRTLQRIHPAFQPVEHLQVKR